MFFKALEVLRSPILFPLLHVPLLHASERYVLIHGRAALAKLDH